jgi:hypothetical protein
MRAWMLGSGVLGLVAACGPVVAPPGGSSDGSTTVAVEEGPPPASTGPVATSGSTTVVPSSEVEVDVDDDGPRLDVLPPDVVVDPPDCPLEWPLQGCGMPSDQSTVAGTTPLGDFATARAVFGGDAGCGGCDVGANVASIVLLGDSVSLDDIDGSTDETLVLWFLDPFEGPVGEPVPAFLHAHRGGVTEQLDDVDVLLDLLPTAEELSEPFVPRTAVVVTGTLTAEAPGWSVAGTFAASYCPDLNSLAICE